MKKDRYSAIIVVEGQTDKALIASFLDAEVVTVNGSAVSRETLEYLQEASKTREIVVLTDPDSPGKRIRDVIASFVPGVKHAFIPKEKAIKRGKVGVAESDKDTVLDALRNLVPNNPLWPVRDRGKTARRSPKNSIWGIAMEKPCCKGSTPLIFLFKS